MKNFVFSILVLIIFVGCTDKNQDSRYEVTSWYKGNLHTHSLWSDGDDFPEMIMDWYRSNGYQFVALSDHNILAAGDKWMEIGGNRIKEEVFDKYQEEYGEDWIETRSENGTGMVRLKTLEEYRPSFEEKGKFLILQSEEITDSYDSKPLHVNATNIKTLIEPKGGSSVSEVLQNNINAVLEQREQTGQPMIPHVNHPNFRYAVSLEDMIALVGEKFFEVYNGHNQVYNLGDSLHISTEQMWDLINIAYLKAGKPLIYGLATDDSHHYHTIGKDWSNAGRGWIMVQAKELAPGMLIEAMEKGSFYASTGVILEEVRFEGNVLTIKAKEEEGVDYIFTFTGSKKGSTVPEDFVSIQGLEANFELNGDIAFVRCRITSTKRQNNPVESMIYEMAWTQPVLFSTNN